MCDYSNEEWRPIEGYEGYEISSMGRAKVVERRVEFNDGRHRTFPEKILKLRKTASGQLQLSVMRPENNTLTVDKLVANAFIPEEDGKDYILHKNLDPSDCSVQNLMRATFDEIKEAYEHFPGDTDDWKDIPGTNGLHQISRDGRVRVHTKVVKVKGGYKVIPEHELKPYDDGSGNYRYWITTEDKGINERVDYLVANAFTPCNDETKVLMHVNMDKHDCRIENLCWVTPEQCILRDTIRLFREITAPGEVWRPVVGFESRYAVSNRGNVAYLPKYEMRNGRMYEFQGDLFSPSVNSLGYRSVYLTCDDGTTVFASVHRLVAKAFIPQPDGLNIVNHLDQTPGHDSVDNLEWTDIRGNNVYGGAIERRVKNTDHVAAGLKRRKPVLQFDMDGNFVKWWDSARAIEQTLGFSNVSISNACLRKRGNKKGNAYGYKWCFEEGFNAETLGYLGACI